MARRARRDDGAAARDALAAHRVVGQVVCHHFKNYLTIAGMCSQVAIDSPDLETARRAAERVREAGRRAGERIEAYRAFVAGEAVPREPDGGVDLAAAAGVALALAAPAIERAPFAIARSLASARAALPPADALALVLTLLANVSLLRPRDEGKVAIATGADARGPFVAVEVAGVEGALDLDGAPARPLADALDGRGFPLPALAGARAIAAAAGGTLDAAPRPDGFRVEARLPAGRGPA